MARSRTKERVISKSDAKKERVKGETVDPIHVLKLMDEVGPSRTSRMLGVSTTTLYKARNNNQVSRVVEVAAEAMLTKATAPGPSRTPMTLSPGDGMSHAGDEMVQLSFSVSQRKMDALLKFAAAIGAEII